MPAPNDRNSRIALAKRWTYHAIAVCCAQACSVWEPDIYTHWSDPSGTYRELPDYVGTVEGLAGLMRELQQEQDRRDNLNPYVHMDGGAIWFWRYFARRKEYLCISENEFDRTYHAGFSSPEDRPGDCVGEAYLSMFEAAADANTEE